VGLLSITSFLYSSETNINTCTAVLAFFKIKNPPSIILHPKASFLLKAPFSYETHLARFSRKCIARA
jgi:hypothetical protein